MLKKEKVCIQCKNSIINAPTLMRAEIKDFETISDKFYMDQSSQEYVAMFNQLK